ncbi:DUF342 domain-containing protein [Limnochorda pilosa]|nr:FapA family protein [Limnochorda pilosa]
MSRVWVEGGEIRVHHEPGTRRHPVLHPGPYVRLWVNDEPVVDTRAIFPGDEVRVEVGQEEQPVEVQHRVTPDGMHCFLSLKGGRSGRLRLMDQPPAQELTLVAVPDRSVPRSGPSVKDLVTYLQEEAGVRVPIDQDALQRLVAGLEEELEVAAGTPPGESEDGRVEYLVPFSVERVEVTDEMTDAVDYLDLQRIPTVTAGTTLALISAGRRGTPGSDVHGQVVEAREPHQPVLRPGPGTRMVDDGRAVVATQAGRPAVQGDLLMVLPTYTVQGDVDVESGHVRFDGDVVVLGSVNEGTKVVAGGRVTVAGSASGATVRGRLGVRVSGGVVGSTLAAGGLAATARALVAEINPMLLALERLLASVHYLKQQPAYQSGRSRRPPDGVLIKRMVEMKFRDLPGLVEQFHGRSEAFDEVDVGLEDVAALLHKLLVAPGPMLLQEIDPLEEAIQQLRVAAYRLEADAATSADITVQHVQNAKLHASGRITIRKGSIFNSEVLAGTGITVHRGVVRGGSLQVFRGEISLDEVGSPSGTRTCLEVVEGGSVQARLLHPNVVVEIAGRRFVADTLLRQVRFTTTQDGELKQGVFRTPPPE